MIEVELEEQELPKDSLTTTPEFLEIKVLKREIAEANRMLYLERYGVLPKNERKEQNSNLKDY